MGVTWNFYDLHWDFFTEVHQLLEAYSTFFCCNINSFRTTTKSLKLVLSSKVHKEKKRETKKKRERRGNFLLYSIHVLNLREENGSSCQSSIWCSPSSYSHWSSVFICIPLWSRKAGMYYWILFTLFIESVFPLLAKMLWKGFF